MDLQYTPPNDDTDSDDEEPQGKIDTEWYNKVAHSKLGPLAICAFGTFIILFMLSPAIVYTILLDGEYFYEIKPFECEMAQYTSAFPQPIAAFYEETQGWTSVAEHTDWYLVSWRVYPYKRGICPVKAQVPDADTYKFFGLDVPEDGHNAVFGVTDHYCLRVSDEDGNIPNNVIKVFEIMDDLNHRTTEVGSTEGMLVSDMVAGIYAVQNVGEYLLLVPLPLSLPRPRNMSSRICLVKVQMKIKFVVKVMSLLRSDRVCIWILRKL